jgi:hypothetical protein
MAVDHIARFSIPKEPERIPVMLVVDTSYQVDGMAPEAVGHMRGGGHTGNGRK